MTYGENRKSNSHMKRKFRSKVLPNSTVEAEDRHLF